jgi:hypothetical protein
MAVIWLVALILGSGFAILTGAGVKWKVLNTLIILGCMAVGLGLGYALGLGRGNFGSVQGEGVQFAMILGIVGAMACMARNTWSSKD